MAKRPKILSSKMMFAEVCTGAARRYRRTCSNACKLEIRISEARERKRKHVTWPDADKLDIRAVLQFGVRFKAREKANKSQTIANSDPAEYPGAFASSIKAENILFTLKWSLICLRA